MKKIILILAILFCSLVSFSQTYIDCYKTTMFTVEDTKKYEITTHIIVYKDYIQIQDNSNYILSTINRTDEIVKFENNYGNGFYYNGIDLKNSSLNVGVVFFTSNSGLKTISFKYENVMFTYYYN